MNETPTAAPAVDKPEDEVQEVMIQVADTKILHKIHNRKKRGKDEMEPVCIPEIPTDSMAGINAYIKLVGVPNFVGTFVREILRPASFEASAAGITETGFNAVKYLEDLKAYFDPRQAKSRGPKKIELYQMQNKFVEELTTLMVKASAGQLQEADKNRFLQIKLELAKIGEAIAKKDRRGKAPTTAPTAAK